MFEWIITSSVLIFVFILLRTFLKGRISLRLQYGLWAIVLVRLLVPFTFGETPFSILTAVENTPRYETFSVTMEQSELPDEQSPVSDLTLGDAMEKAQNALPAESKNTTDSKEETPVAPALTESLEAFDWKLLTILWMIGMVGMALWFLIGNLAFSLRLKKNRQFFETASSHLPIYVSDQVDTPCLFGLFRPVIYLTPASVKHPDRLAHVRAHEETHYRHKDHIWALLRCVCLIIHWYNPLVWLAAVLSRRDCELACDEGTLLRLGKDQRVQYGRTLIDLTCQGRGGLLTTATTMTGSKKTLRERVLLIAKKPRTTALTLTAAILVCAIAVGCTFTGGVNKEEQENIQTIEGFLNAYYTVPDSRWVEAERELREIIQETGEAPKEAEDYPQHAAVQAMFGDYIPEENVSFWFNTANYLHSSSYDSQNDYAVLYTITPREITVKPRTEESGSRWDAQVELIFQADDGESTELTMTLLMGLDDTGKISGMKESSESSAQLQRLISDALNVQDPLRDSGSYASNAITILSTTPVEGIEEVRLAVLEGEEDQSVLFGALRDALSGIECTDRFLTDWLKGVGLAQLHQAAEIYGFASEFQTIQMNMTDDPLQREYYAKTLVTNQYGKEKLVNIVGTAEFTEDGELDAISVRGGLDSFLKAASEFAEEGKPVEREWTEENRMRWSSEGDFDSLSAEESEGLSYKEVALLWAEKEAERYSTISSEENPLYCTEVEILRAEPTAIDLTSPNQFVFVFNLACKATDPNGFLMMQGNGYYVDETVYPEYAGWNSAGSFIEVQQQADGSWIYVNGGSGGLGGWGYLNLDQNSPEHLTRLFDELTEEGDPEFPEGLIWMLPFADWAKFDADYGEAGWQELTDLLMVYGLNGRRWYSDVHSWLEVYPEDQLYRNLYVMHAAIAAGEEYGQRFTPILQNQKNYSPDDFERSLEELSAEEQNFISDLIA